MRAALAIAVVFLNAGLLAHFHDRFWWPVDEGNYAHVAERILDGEVLHADVQDVHPGYVNFANAGAMALFGRELVSMRYPLVLLGVAQSALVFALLQPFGAAAAVGATAVTALGFLQFLDPTAHWYVLFLAVLLAWTAHRLPPGGRLRLELLGAIVMTAVLFRQLSGVFLAMGTLAWLLLERPPADARDARAAPRAARLLVAIMQVGLVGYLLRATDIVGWAFFGLWPVLLLAWTGWVTRIPDRQVVAMCGRMALGASVAALPLVAYHAAHGSIGAWYRDVVVAAVSLPALPFIRRMSYAGHLGTAVEAMAAGDPAAMANGAFWVVLTLAAPLLGVLLLRRVARPGSSPRDVAALPVLATFYAVVSVHYQIPIYLTYTAGLSLVAVMWLTRGAMPVVAGVAVLIPIAVRFHAAQPLSRGVAGAAAGQRIALAETRIPRVGLAIEPADTDLYERLLAVIRREVPVGATMLAVPGRAELYFLAERRNPVPFFNTALGMRTPAQLGSVLNRLERDPPRLVIDDPSDKYHTAESRALIAYVQRRYERLPSVGPFDLYRLR